MITYFDLKIDVNGDNPFTTISGLTLVQRYDRHHTFELKVPLETVENAGTETLDRSKNFVGQSIKFEITNGNANGDFGSGAGTTQSEFNGVITSVSVRRYGGTASDLVIKGFSPTIILEHGKNTQSFDNLSLSSLVRTITSRLPGNGINFKINPSPDPTIVFTLQYKESFFNFLARQANRWGQWFYFNGKDCVFGSPPGGDAIELRFGTDLSVFELGMAMAPSKFKTSGHASNNNEKVEVGPQNVSNLDQFGRSAYESSNNYFFDEQVFNTELRVSDSGVLTDIATARRAAIAGGMVTLQGTSTNAQLKIGSTISVKADAVDGGSTVDYGTYILTAISHTMDGRGHYQNYFESIPSALTVPPPIAHVHEPIIETQSAAVVQLGPDNGRGSVYIRFFWQKDDEKIGPCRVVYPQAGQNHGFLFMPEVGDEVMVTFGNNNTDCPVVIGSLYNGRNNQSDRADKDNYIKTIRTKAGNEIKFNDKSGQEEILITNPNNNNQISLSLADNGKISIQSQGKIEMKGQAINIEAQGDLTIKGANISATADQKLGLKATTDMDIKAMNVKVNSDVNLDMQGTKISVKADAELSADGGGMTEIKGATIKIDGSALTSVQGGMVMIN